MRTNALLVALTTSTLLVSSTAGAAIQGLEWPDFEDVDQDGDNTITLEEAREYPAVLRAMETDDIETVESEQEYENLEDVIPEDVPATETPPEPAPPVDAPPENTPPTQGQSEDAPPEEEGTPPEGAPPEDTPVENAPPTSTPN